MPLQRGTKLGPYQIDSPIGAGGMGEVYKATDTRLERTVAIKVLPAHVASDPERKSRFEREAKTISSLNHPHICTLHDVGREGETDFLVMEYLEGETLADRLQKGALPLDQSLKYAIEIADALDKAHRQGVTHRDLKPANIMLTKAGAKLLDFGLAKLTPTGPQSDASTKPADALTEQGTILGTFQYMAPEQLEGKDADARTDIWAFGCVVYEMVTGKKAFEETNQASLIRAIMGVDPPAPSSVESMSSASLDYVVKTCLAKDPDDRWQSAGDLRRELQRVSEAGSKVRPPVTETRPGRAFAVGLAIVAVIVASATAWRLARVASVTPVARFVMSLPPTEALDPRLRPAVALSPEGTRLVYVARQNETTQLYVRSIDGFEATPILGTEGGSGPFFSPDGEWVGFLRGGQLMKVALSGGAPLVLSAAALGRGASWGPNNVILFTATPGTGLWRTAATGGTAEVITNLDRDLGEVTHRWPEILPGGQAVLFTIRTGRHASFSDASIVALSLVSGERHYLVEGTQPRYVPDHLIFAREGTLYAVPFDVDELRVSGTPVPVQDGVMTDPVTGAAHFSVSDSGSLLYVPGGEWLASRRLMLVDHQGGRRPLMEAIRPFQTPRLSPDGERLTVMVEAATDDVWVSELASGTLSRLTFETGSNVAPIWSPDGDHIAFASNRAAGPYNLYRKSADGSGAAQQLTDSEYTQFPTSWSPDGRFLAFVESHPTTGSDIWILPFEDQDEPRPFLDTPFNERGAAFSPDGRWVAYSSDEAGSEEVYVQPFVGALGKRQISTDGGQNPVWAASGRELFYRNGAKIMSVPLTLEPQFTMEAPRVLFEEDYEVGALTGLPNYDVAPDGQGFVMLETFDVSPPTQIRVILNWTEELKALVPTP